MLSKTLEEIFLLGGGGVRDVLVSSPDLCIEGKEDGRPFTSAYCPPPPKKKWGGGGRGGGTKCLFVLTISFNVAYRKKAQSYLFVTTAFLTE